MIKKKLLQGIRAYTYEELTGVDIYRIFHDNISTILNKINYHDISSEEI